MGPLASALRDEGLLDWSTALVGYRRYWLSTEDVIEAAVSATIKAVDPISTELAELTSANRLPRPEVEDILVALAHQGPPVTEETVVRRWLLAHLVELERTRLSDDATLMRLQEIYAEFGFPEELRYANPYNLTFDEWAAKPAVGRALSSPLGWFRSALADLRHELLSSADERRTTENGG